MRHGAFRWIVALMVIGSGLGMWRGGPLAPPQAAAAGALAVDKLVTTHQTSASSSISSPSFTTSQSGELLVAFVASDGPASSKQTFSTVTGGGLVWRLRQRTNTQAGTAEIWQAVAQAVLTNATVKATRASGSFLGSLTVATFTGASTTSDGATAGANAASGAASASLVTTSPGSWVWGVADDWDQALARTVGPNQTMVDQFLASSGDTFWVQRQTAPTSLAGSTVTINDSAPTADRWNLSLIEIPSANVDTTPPTAPTNLIATGAIGSANLTWTAATDNVGVTAYDLYRSSTPGFTANSSTKVGQVNGTTLAYLDTAVTVGTYYYQVRAEDAAGNLGPSSNEASATVLTDTIPPTAPTNLAAVANGPNSVNLTWGAATDNVAVSGYTVLRGGSPIGTTATLAYTDSTVLASTTYTYTVTAQDAAGNVGPPSNTATVSTGAGQAPVISSFVASPSTITVGQSTTLSWSVTGSPTPTLSIDNGVGSVSGTSMIVSPTQTTTYTLTATSSAGTVTAQTTVIVTGAPSIALIQKATSISGGASSIAATFSKSVTAGNLIVVGVSGWPDGGILRVTDSLGNIYAQVGSPSVTTGSSFSSLFYAKNSKAGTDVLTFSNGVAGTQLSMVAAEFSGIDPNAPLDGSANASGSNNAPSSGSMTPTIGGDLLIGSGTHDATLTTSPGANMSMVSIATENGNSDQPLAMDYQVLSSASAASATFLLSTSASWAQSGVLFRPAGGSTGQTYSLSGSISPPSSGSGSTVSLSGSSTATVTADANGNFVFTGLANGSYTVTPSKSGFTFTPASQPVTINNGNATGITFTISPLQTGIQLIQKIANGNENATGTMTVALPANVTAGNFLIVSASAARPASTLTIADSVGDTFLPAYGPIPDPAQDVNLYVWYVQAAKGGPTTFTISPPAPAALEIHVSEWSGMPANVVVDQTSSSTGNGTVASSGGKTTTANGELVFGYTWELNTASAGSGFTGLSLINGDLDEYQIQASAGNIASTFTQSSPGAWLALMVTFEAAPSDTTPPTISLTSPITGTTVSSTISVAANASDNVGVTGVQFTLDGANLGAAVTTSPYTVQWDTTTASNGSHTLAAVARDAAGNTTTAQAVSVTVSNGAGDPATVGQWGPVMPWPEVSIHAALTPSGKILTFQGDFTQNGQQYLLNPTTGTYIQVPNAAVDLFCAGQAVTPDGRILVIGGTSTSGGLGIKAVTAFDPATETWQNLAPMKYARWYGTGTTLGDGRIMATSGDNLGAGDVVPIPEIYDVQHNTWNALTGASNAMPVYPFIYQLPDGRILHAGGSEVPTATEVLNLATQTWTTIDPRIIDGASIANYAPGKFIKVGSASDDGGSGQSTNTAFTLDMNQPNPTWQPAAPMAFRRSFVNLTNLPDGTILATGGSTDKSGYIDANAVLPSEIWNPATGTWRTVAALTAPRLYHSVAVLLPDGRVFVSGSGGTPGVTDQDSYQIYSPPYLFKGPRPTITSAPATVQYNSSQFVATPDAASITSVSLIRTGSVTHSFDQNARAMSLSFTQTTGGLNIQMPVNGNTAPPGYYLLSIVNNQGVPSASAFVRFPAPYEDTIPPTAPANLMATGAIGSANLTWTAATDNVGVTAYDIYRSSTPGFTADSSTKVGQVSGTTLAYLDTAVTVGTYYYQVRAEDAVGNIGPSSNEASATVLTDTIPPTAPTNLAAVANGPNSVNLTWGAASDNVAVSGYTVLRGGSPIGTTATLAYTDSTVLASTTYTYTVTAQDAAGNVGPPSNTASVTTPSKGSALTVDTSVTTHQTTAGRSISTPPLSTTGANELLVAFIGSDGPSAGPQSITAVTGGGLTWRLRQRTNGQSGTAEIWQAVAPTPLSNVTITATRASGSFGGSITVTAFQGADTTTDGAVAGGNNTAGAPTASLTTTRAGSWIWAVGSDYDQALARTVGANQTKVDEFLAPTGDTFWVQRQTNPTPTVGTAVTINDTAPTADRWNLSLIEILPAP